MACALGELAPGHARSLCRSGVFPSPPPPRPAPSSPGPPLQNTQSLVTRRDLPPQGSHRPAPIVHLRANDVEKQQVHGRSRAGLSSGVRCKQTPTPQHRVPLGGGGGGGGCTPTVPYLSIPGSLVSSSNFGEFSPNHSRRTYQIRSGSPAAGMYHIPAPPLTRFWLQENLRVSWGAGQPSSPCYGPMAAFGELFRGARHFAVVTFIPIFTKKERARDLPTVAHRKQQQQYHLVIFTGPLTGAGCPYAASRLILTNCTFILELRKEGTERLSNWPASHSHGLH